VIAEDFVVRSFALGNFKHGTAVTFFDDSGKSKELHDCRVLAVFIICKHWAHLLWRAGRVPSLME
jgi:hypothetical protein